MRVKIGDEWYDGGEQAVQVELSDTDKNNIKNMAEDAILYAVYPDDWFDYDRDKTLKWMIEGSKKDKEDSN